MNSPGENYIRMLIALAFSANAHRVLEIGAGPECGSGQAFCDCMSGNFGGGVLWSLDIEPGRPSPRLMSRAQDFNVRWRAACGDSLSMPLPDEVQAGGFDLLYIDGDHSEKHVEGDFWRFAPLVRPEGLVVFDDYLLDGVRNATSALHVLRLHGTPLCYDHEIGNAHYVLRLPKHWPWERKP